MKTKKSKKPVAGVTPGLKLEVPAGFGFTAAVTDDGFLQLQQANSDGELTDTVVLTKNEARRLFQEFGEWTA